ncbi:MAG TPA: GAF domain-containing protein, partial [Ramlibacter sp.]|nr:GAF domain-containing protein [Ramlibacter sp.]
RQNILANPRAVVQVLHPQTAEIFRLHIRYLRTETAGPLFEGMRAQLAGIASHSGMEGVFRLLGSDVYEVETVEEVEGEPLPAAPVRGGQLAAVRRCSEHLARCATLEDALNAVLRTLNDALGVRHAMVLMLDASAERLYTVASSGYATSGVGSELCVGQGVVGVAARERTPVRIGHMTNAALYSQAMRHSLASHMPDFDPATEIPYPGLAQPHSQLAAPILSAGRLLGVLFVESPDELQFSWEHEDALVAMAGHLGATIDLVQTPAEPAEAAAPAPQAAVPAAGGTPLQLRRYASNGSIFIDGEYLIKGVAGAILWKLAHEHQQQGRTDFSNRELRLDPAIGLPDGSDNLEARLVLLQRRLAEQSPHLRIEKTGRGRFRLLVGRPLALVAG